MHGAELRPLWPAVQEIKAKEDAPPFVAGCRWGMEADVTGEWWDTATELGESTVNMNKQLRLREDNPETDLELTNNEMLCRNDGDSTPVKFKMVT